MKVIADDKIPHISDFFTACDEIIYLPGEMITHADLQDADILLTRTVTTVDKKLLANTSVKFVGSATTGTDHVDEEWLASQNIRFATAAGANSQAVAEYVLCCIAALKKQNYWRGKNLVAGIIGCGRIGTLITTLLAKLNFDVICYDPFLSQQLNFNFVPLEKLMERADLISIHTPLTKTGLYSTFHMLNDVLLKKIKKNAVLFNTARGGVIDQSALLQTENLTLCLDVWENEPHISLELLHKVMIGTPHIAGYSVNAKYRATEMIYESAAEFFGWNKITINKNNVDDVKKYSFLGEKNWEEKILAHYDPIKHTQQFQKAFRRCQTTVEIEKIFIQGRKKYSLRNQSA